MFFFFLCVFFFFFFFFFFSRLASVCFVFFFFFLWFWLLCRVFCFFFFWIFFFFFCLRVSPFVPRFLGTPQYVVLRLGATLFFSPPPTRGFNPPLFSSQPPFVVSATGPVSVAPDSDPFIGRIVVFRHFVIVAGMAGLRRFFFFCTLPHSYKGWYVGVH